MTQESPGFSRGEEVNVTGKLNLTIADINAIEEGRQ